MSIFAEGLSSLRPIFVYGIELGVGLNGNFLGHFRKYKKSGVFLVNRTLKIRPVSFLDLWVQNWLSAPHFFDNNWRKSKNALGLNTNFFYKVARAVIFSLSVSLWKIRIQTCYLFWITFFSFPGNPQKSVFWPKIGIKCIGFEL